MGVRGRIEISAAALLAVAAGFIFGQLELLLAIALCALCHELGHVFALRCCGAGAGRMRVGLFGVTMGMSSALPYRSDILIAAAGPGASLLLALAAAAVGRIFDLEFAYFISGMSAALFAFNLLPAYPLDGGRILLAGLSAAVNPDCAERAVCISTCVFSLAVTAAGVYQVMVTRENFTLVLAGLWLFICYCKRGGNSIKSIR